MANNSPDKRHNKGQGDSKKKRPAPVPRTTVDDPENDIFDDEIFDDDSVLPKASPREDENFEKPW